MNDWISVKDRLPEYDEPVFGYDGELADMGIVNYLNGEFFDLYGDDMNVTHWMPLPEPPKERGDTKIKTVPGHGELSNDQADNMAAYIDHRMQRVNCIENEAIEEDQDG